MWPHADEDGRCSWCGWAPDPAYVESLALWWGGDAAAAERDLWEVHCAKHRSGLLPRPPALQEDTVLAEARVVLWLCRQPAPGP